MRGCHHQWMKRDAAVGKLLCSGGGMETRVLSRQESDEVLSEHESLFASGERSWGGSPVR